MTKPVTRRMAVDCLLYRMGQPGCTSRWRPADSIHHITVLLCPECGEPLLPGQVIQFDHTHADKLGGAHEYQNLRPIHYDPCHKQKSARDVAALAKIDRITGVTGNGPKAKIRSRPFQKISRPFQKGIKSC